MFKSGIVHSFVSHQRYFPRKYRFNYQFFWCFFDLDELEGLSKKTWPFSYNKFNFVSFFDRDHFSLGQPTLKENVIELLKQNNVTDDVISIKLMTNIRILGYVFNPVSFYFVQTKNSPYLIIEIGNTFSELKPYFVSPKHLEDGVWTFKTMKEFYISPFISLDNTMTFKISHKSDKVSVLIDDVNKNGELELKAIYTGTIEEWSSKKLLYNFFRFPLISFRIITAIHYHAFKLFMMKIPYFKKKENTHLQTGVYQWKQGYYQKKDS